MDIEKDLTTVLDPIERQRQHLRNSYWRHREERLRYSRVYYQMNRERALEYARQRRRENPEYHKEYYLRNRERLLEYARQYREAHRDQVRRASRECMQRLWERRKKEKGALKGPHRDTLCFKASKTAAVGLPSLLSALGASFPKPPPKCEEGDVKNGRTRRENE